MNEGYMIGWLDTCITLASEKYRRKTRLKNLWNHLGTATQYAVGRIWKESWSWKEDLKLDALSVEGGHGYTIKEKVQFCDHVWLFSLVSASRLLLFFFKNSFYSLFILEGAGSSLLSRPCL